MYAMTQPKDNVVSLETAKDNALHVAMDDVSERVRDAINDCMSEHDISGWTASYAAAMEVIIDLQVRAEDGSTSAGEMLRDLAKECLS